ncbi:uncharacterized protein F5Z01DRAFT_147113 [Emericellopsis atlantica]|uniref:FAD-binding domain-containing protein n=1 Tax=Emericellopsis atlantica TaxID=2614577 RepID=A0A9P7ZKF0_9HYPO|nr:uncharacterized protein F5Z01DRAFT_147113 [Emericellopsis atlantica]KAG9253571.1 hypothetical protein F5Z01DRAFT_147113 [Emericellopsis atlantica]
MGNMKILISGAGMAGSTLAFWLSKLGHNVTVIERFPHLRASGLQLDLRGHGIEVMKRMGLEDAFRAKRTPEQGFELVGSSGMRWAYFPANKSGQGPQSFTTEYEIMRSDLCHILHDTSKERVRYIFGTSIASFKEDEDAVEVCFHDKTTERFDLLVGADGQGSRTRKMMMGRGKPDGFHPMDDTFAGYVTIPRTMEKGEGYNAKMYMAPGGRAIMTRRHSPDQMQAYLTCNFTSDRMKAIARGPVQGQKEAIAEAFKGVGWKAEEIMKAMMEDNDFYLAELGIVKLDKWYKGRIALVGDAAYCPSANTGMGTSSAIVGAYILAGEIGKYCAGGATRETLAAALDSYDRKFRPFMDQVQKGLLDGGGFSGWMPQSALGITIMNCLAGAASLLRIDLASKLMREEIKDWELPEYEGVFKA